MFCFLGKPCCLLYEVSVQIPMCSSLGMQIPALAANAIFPLMCFVVAAAARNSADQFAHSASLDLGVKLSVRFQFRQLSQEETREITYTLASRSSKHVLHVVSTVLISSYQ